MLKRLKVIPNELWEMAALAIAAGGLFGAVTNYMIRNVPGSDFNGHIQFAYDIVQQGVFARSHILFQLIAIFLTRVLNIDLESAAWLAATTFYIFTVLILYVMIRNLQKRQGSVLLAGALALSLLLVSQVNLFTYPEHKLYFGYIGLNVLHNPTMIMVKPLVLLMFVFSLGVLNGSVRLRWQTIGIGVLLSFLSVLAKPNSLLVLLPAVIAVLAYHALRRNIAVIKVAVIALVLPMAIILAIDYIVQYNFIDGGGGIDFAPLATVLMYEPSVTNIIVKFFLSILFPLTVYFIYIRQTTRDLALNFSWLLFLAGAGQMYLFSEEGLRAGDGNFWWSAQIGLFVLFAISALFLLRHFHDKPRWRGWLCLAIFALHLLSGWLSYRVQFQIYNTWEWW